MRLLYYVLQLSSKETVKTRDYWESIGIDRIVSMRIDEIFRSLWRSEIEQKAAATIPPRDANNFTIGKHVFFI